MFLSYMSRHILLESMSILTGRNHMLVDINLSSGRPASSIRMNISMWHQYQQEIGYLFQKVVPKPKKMLHKHPNIHPFGKWEKKAAGIGNIYSGRIGRFERL